MKYNGLFSWHLQTIIIVLGDLKIEMVARPSLHVILTLFSKSVKPRATRMDL